MSELPQTRFASSPLLILAGAISAGILLGHRFTFQSNSILIISIAGGVSIAIVSVAFLSKKKLTLALGSLVAAFFCAGFVLSLIDSRPSAPNRIARMYDEGLITSSEPVEITGTVQGQPEAAPGSFYLTLRTESIRFKGSEHNASGTVLLLAPVREQQGSDEYRALELRHGARIRVMTTLDRDDTFRNPGGMQFTEYLERNDFEATGVIKSPLLVERLDDDSVFLPLAWLYDWREELQQKFSATFSAETSGVLNAALLGNRYGLSQSAADRFRAGGTFHVLVISGMQISFIGAVVFLSVGWLARNRIWRFTLAALLIWLYTVAVGGDAPVARAALMFTLVILAPVVWRRANSLNVMGATALLLFVWRPTNLFDPSFQLTFLSVLAIVLLAVPLMQTMQRVGSWVPTTVSPYPPACPGWFRTLSEALFWSEANWRAEMRVSNISYRLFKNPIAAKLERWHVQKLCRFMFATVIASGTVQIAMLVPMIVYFHRLSFSSLLLNIFVGVLMALIAIVAVVAVIIAQVNVSLAAPLAWTVEKFNWLMIHAVDPFEHFGIASVRLPHYSGWMALVYVLYYVPLALLVVALARWNPLDLSAKSGRRTRSRRVLVVTVTSLIALFGVIVAHPFSAARADGKLHVQFLDVGQGDSALLTMPNGTTLLIDGGGRPNVDWERDGENDEEPFQRDTRTIGESVVSEFLWSKGLDHVDYVLATHADADHIDGLNDVVRNFKVRGAIVARTPANDAGFARFAKSLNAAGVPLEVIGSGDSIEVAGATVDVLWPPQLSDVNFSYRNNDAVVLRLRYGDRILLFTADIEKEAENALLRNNMNLHTDVIKVAHHGSRTSSTQAFVDATRASIAIISVGRTSIFGHPHKEVVERWHASGAEVMTTGEKGTISVVSDGKTLAISTYVQ
jgi:competence protein ComEC